MTKRNIANSTTQWWRGGAIYQIYPRSFFDANGDGIGDLAGITHKLDYVASLNVDAIWISPFFMSPMKDFGYDVANFREVDPIFGTMHDFEILMEKAHSLGLKVIIDLVLSHTSNEHEWFIESCKSKDNPKSDYYVWADPKPDGSPPNNWQSVFGGSAWQFYAHRGQYYLHNFLVEQPDLNYHNPAVQQEALDTAKFWLDKGVDGFRLDVVNFYFHDKQLRDNPPKQSDGNGSIQYEGLWPYTMQSHLYDKSQSENIPFLEKLRAFMDQYDDKFLVGEVGDDTPFDTAAEYTKGDKRLHTAYSTAMMAGQDTDVKAGDISTPVIEEKSINGQSWPCWAFSNHDVVRVATRWQENNPDHNPNYPKMLIGLLGCLRGSFCLYQGEELALPEAQLSYDDLVDPWGIALWPEWQGRDGCRTPMPWDANTPQAGFTLSHRKPWLPVVETHIPLSVSVQEAHNDSTLNFTRQFLQWRKNHNVLKNGEIDFIDEGSGVLHFTRLEGNMIYRCIFNLTPNPVRVETDQTNLLYALDAELSGRTVSLSSFGFAVCGD